MILLALQTFLRTDPNTNGVATTRDGRVFVGHPTAKPGQPRVTEWVGGRERPFPPGKWNAYKPGDDAAKGFVLVNSLRIGPDGSLWLVDVGAPAIGKPNLPGGPKLVQVDLTTNRVKRVYLVSAIKPRTGIDDVRFNGREAYLSDAGAPGLIVLDLVTGRSRRVLDGHPSMTDAKDLRAEGKVLRDPSGKPIRIHADQMEVTADGGTLYYQACSGPMYKIPTRWLANDVSDAQRARHIRPFAPTRTTGGTAIDARGNVYVSDVEGKQIVRYTPAGRRRVVVRDPRLIWPDALWIDDGGNLLIPAAQMNRTAGENGGKERTVFPVEVYKLAISAEPVRR